MHTTEELKKLDLKKLTAELAELQNHLVKLKFDIRSGQAKDTHTLKATKKQIARVRTIINRK